MDRQILLGKVVNTSGLMGDVKVIYHADSPDIFDRITDFFTADGVQLKLTAWSAKKHMVVMKFSNIDTIEKAENLKGKELYVYRHQLPPLEGGRHYVVDLLGLDVLLTNGRKLGVISDVFNTGSNDIYVVKGEKEYLIPIIDGVVKDMSIDRGFCIVEPLEGLLDDEN